MDNVKLYDLTIPQKSIYLTEQYASGTTVNLISGDTFFEEKVNSCLIEKALNIYIQKNILILSFPNFFMKKSLHLMKKSMII